MTQQAYGMGITFIFQAGISVLVIMMAVQLTVPSLSWILWGALVIHFSIVLYFSKKVHPFFYGSRNAFGDLTTTIRENILGAQVVRIFNSQEKELDKFSQNNRKFRDNTVNSIKYTTIMMNSMRIFLGSLIIVIMYFGGKAVIDGTMIIGTLIAFLTYATMVFGPMNMLNNVVVTFIQADASFKRINEILVNLGEIVERPDALPVDDLQGEIIFQNVTFKYSEAPVLNNISFQVNPGEKIAIMGTTGSGKSTLISLIPRFYDPVSGEVILDGHDLREYQTKELRKSIGFVSQEIFLFTNSIKENIRFGKEDATDEEVIEAAQRANIDDFINSLPGKYDTVIGERGIQLSGGQKQRLAIARALLINPKILILDDSTSSVDVQTERRIQQALDELMEDKTTFIITQRLSTIRNVDRIMVLDRGNLVGYDTHDELIESNALYRQMYETLFVKQREIDQNTEEVRAE
jgi:ABC-type multidrug transport system fused ATPase/permease subunit